MTIYLIKGCFVKCLQKIALSDVTAAIIHSGMGKQFAMAFCPYILGRLDTILRKYVSPNQPSIFTRMFSHCLACYKKINFSFSSSPRAIKKQSALLES